jgi:hypothetical protein
MSIVKFECTRDNRVPQELDFSVIVDIEKYEEALTKDLRSLCGTRSGTVHDRCQAAEETPEGVTEVSCR